jgi:hypothetical protein
VEYFLHLSRTGDDAGDGALDAAVEGGPQ